MIDYIIELIAAFFAVALILSFHEFAHAHAAVKNGDLTPKLYNRYTLNPMAHFDILGILAFTLVGFGWAKPVPINPGNFNNYRKGLFWTSIAGVLTNYVLAFLFCPLYILAFKYLPDMMLFDDLIKLFLYFCFAYNLSFCVFNLLPLYPLDGFRLFEALNRRRGRIYMFLRNYGHYILLGLIALSYIARMTSFYQLDILGYVLSFAINIFGWPITAFWGLIF